MTPGSRELPDAKTVIVTNTCFASGYIEVTVELESWCRVLPGFPGFTPGGGGAAPLGGGLPPGGPRPPAPLPWLIYRLIDTALLRAGIA